ncbi:MULTISPECIES: hydrogenase expression/formation protein HypE [Anoxybacillus]|uniref:(NiFe) hydrogenase metallocenter assembly protein HypE n=1 Tax=Anoxybacillus flavithermus TaxID=33934 RepID=A0A178T4V9_9BACL|nr:hydrogenase expression/formation protein HypE [Anoxybacillus flavithermus]ASA95968.1 hydrogenase expression/formation protein HypE [Anoxybacillus flavithermus]ELK21934.1 hydrogenase expression/formation protein HypE [Anoxybacillus flavithermus TNO-09.006]MBE2908238.1 hydrogenase expression/formation protein HypE [Anoxybacillus flavithermus]MBE2910966.1 hydrogenase expression/formation protein HypE [Anoxybacillus flavithermus]MBE2917196.1 hydrogenase expression/formation protein HypE [Anoxyb
MERITLAHGDGGELAHKLITDVFVSTFRNERHAKFDAATFALGTHELAVTTDSFVIKPIFFPGGNIGKLAVAGTINDLAVVGAIPKVLTCSFIIEEGFPIRHLKTVVQSMAEEAKKTNVAIVAGDTKVVERGSADGLYINTTGIGIISHPLERNMDEGDSVIVSGSVGDHGVAVLVARGELGLVSTIESDCTSLYLLVAKALEASQRIRLMRDPTRGGLATTLVEICEDFGVTIELEEECIPVKKEVKGACELLGFDPLYLANEGKVVMIVPKEDEQAVLDALRSQPEGKDAAVIGTVRATNKGQLLLRTPLGTTRRLYRLTGLMLPRIC